ncbi:pyocin S6 family toxin immunity protein [Rahnella bonaserana]|jgi:hypothetical protein
MTMIYTVDAFNRTDELLDFEIEIPKENLPDISIVMKWSASDYNDFVAGLGGFDLTEEQVKAIENILNKHFFRDDLDFQISSSEM